MKKTLGRELAELLVRYGVIGDNDHVSGAVFDGTSGRVEVVATDKDGTIRTDGKHILVKIIPVNLTAEA